MKLWSFATALLRRRRSALELQRGIASPEGCAAAISQTILDLEDELGVKLLLRTKRSVQ
jgi:hypothetical protein